MFSNSARQRRLTLIAAGIALVSALAACSSSSSPGGGAGGASAAADAAGGEDVSAAQTIVDQSTKLPTTIPITTPLTSAPAKGKTLVWLKCDTATCGPLSDGIKAGLSAVGWNYKELSYKSADPATLVAAFKQALNYSPSAVAVSGIPPEAGWSSIIPQYEAKGIPIIASFLSNLTYSKTLIADIGGPMTYGNSAKMVANWFIADSGGKGTAVLNRIDDFPILKTWSDQFASAVKAGCPGCTVVDLKSTIPDVFGGKVTQASISKLRSTPNAQYLIGCDTEFMEGMDAALSAAGLAGKVKFGGQGATVGQLTALKSKTGAEAAFTGLALHYAGWSIVDVALRHSLGMTFDPEAGGLPMQLITPTSEKITVSTSYDEPTDYADQFKKLWQVT